MKQLDRLLFLQGNRCFFCARPIPEGEASVEHLVATSNGGAKDDENCVACCRSINIALGSLSVKAKLQAILNHRSGFTCPHAPQAHPEANALASNGHLLDTRVGLVIADLQKRGASKPRRTETLKNTMNSVFQMQLADDDLDGLLNALQSRGCISVAESKVTYALPAPQA